MLASTRIQVNDQKRENPFVETMMNASQRFAVIFVLLMLVVWTGPIHGASSAVTAPQNSSAKANSNTPTGIPLPYGKEGPNSVLTYVLVDGPKHGKVELPEPHKKFPCLPAHNAIYISAQDYVGADSFTWKLRDGTTESEVATCSVTVNAKHPFPKVQVAYAVEDRAIDIPAAFSGGGGFVYAIRPGNPLHGKLTLSGNTFHYTPAQHFTGTDWFTWTIDYASSKDANAGQSSTQSAACWLVVKPAGMNDWPQWRADECRSGFTSMTLPPTLHLQWRRDQAATISPFCTPEVTSLHFNQKHYLDIDYCRPVQMGKLLFVPATACDSLAAYHTDTGVLQWRFYANGAVRRPPVAMALSSGEKVVLFGSDDGWVYCLNAADGSERWKFRAAPNNRKALGFGRLASVWPIWASPVARDGKVYFAAGYVSTFGLYAYCLDVATGAVVWVNDGRISDMWNNSGFGPLAFSYDGTKLYGSVEGSCRPWVLNAATGEFLGHLGVGFNYPGVFRDGSNGWYVDGKGAFAAPAKKWRKPGTVYDDPEPMSVTPGSQFYKELAENEHNEREPMSITVGSRTISAADVAAWGVTGTVASLLAGDGKLFATTAEGGIYCFGGTQIQPKLYPYKPSPLPEVSDEWTVVAKTMLSQKALQQGLALVCGIQSGRLVEELARQSSLVVVAVDPDHKKLQALRARMDAAGLSGERVSILEGNPLDFAFSPYIAALVTSEDPKFTGAVKPEVLERLYACTRPFGGEIWLPTSDKQQADLAASVAASKKMPLCEVHRAGGYTQVRRTGMPEDNLRLKPPFGLVSYGGAFWKDFDAYYDWPADTAKPWLLGPKAATLRDPKADLTAEKVSTEQSVFTSMINPLYSAVEKFPGLPVSGNEQSCNAAPRYRGDFGWTHGKVVSFFDASSNYWGRMFMPQTGNCYGSTTMWKGLIGSKTGNWPGGVCGCVAAAQFTLFTLAPMEGEESWVAYQTARSSNPIEDQPIKKVGINFGAPGDRYVAEDGVLWTHHPFAGNYGLISHNPETITESWPLVPVSYHGSVRSVYHHSAQMERIATRDHNWVSASQVLGMTGLTVHLAQPVVAKRTAATPNLDGHLSKDFWKPQKRLIFAANKMFIDLVKDTGQPKADEHCYAMTCYDDANLYIAAGVHAGFGRWPHIVEAKYPVLHDVGMTGRGTFDEWLAKQIDRRRQLVVTLNNRERIGEDVVLTGLLIGDEQKKESKGISPRDANWSFAAATTGSDPFTAEIAIPWNVLAAAGLRKEQLLINISVAGSPLTARYTPLYLDSARGAVTETHPHTVRLYFAEMEGKTPGQRVFDVSLQGKTVLENLDVAKEAGGPKRELVKEFKDIGISSGLDIGFASHAGEAMLSGVEIIGNYTSADHASHLAPSSKN